MKLLRKNSWNHSSVALDVLKFRTLGGFIGDRFAVIAILGAQTEKLSYALPVEHVNQLFQCVNGTSPPSVSPIDNTMNK